jgi:hypothetical protein
MASPGVFDSLEPSVVRRRACARRKLSLSELAAEDLGDALLADLQDLGDRLLGQAGSVGDADLLVAFGLQLLARALDLALSPREVLGKCFQADLGGRCFARRTGDPSIVVTILTS